MNKFATIMIIGYAWSGTTMLAGIFECFGVPMVGDNYLPMAHEDQDFRWKIRESEDVFRAFVEELPGSIDV